MATKTAKFRSKTEFRQSVVRTVRLLRCHPFLPLFLPRNFAVLISHLFRNGFWVLMLRGFASHTQARRGVRRCHQVPSVQ